MNDLNLLIVISSYYKDISSNLLSTTKDYLDSLNIKYDVETVLGSLEIPQVINFYLKSRNSQIFDKYCGIIALGCVIKGETYHFEIVSNESNRNLMDLSLKYSKPIGNGIITAFKYDQAINRSFKKGIEASKACIDLIKIKNKLEIKID